VGSNFVSYNIQDGLMGSKPCQNIFLHPILFYCRKIRKILVAKWGTPKNLKKDKIVFELKEVEHNDDFVEHNCGFVHYYFFVNY